MAKQRRSGEGGSGAGGQGGCAAPRHTGSMGFDPTRKHRKSPLDYVFVGVGVALCIGLVAWALFG